MHTLARDAEKLAGSASKIIREDSAMLQLWILAMKMTILAFALLALFAVPWSLCSPAAEKDLSIEHRTILGITLGQANLAGVQKQLGEARLWGDGDAATLEEKICYVTQGPDSLIVVFALNAEMAGTPGNKLTDIRILKDRAYPDRANCRSLSIAKDLVGTTSGLKMGIRRENVRRILGPPTRVDNSKWNYSWSIERSLPAADENYQYWLARKEECFDSKNPFFTVGSEITIQFDGDEVVALTFTRGDSIC